MYFHLQECFYFILFTFLMFRKPNEIAVNKNKTIAFHLSKSFWFLFVFRYYIRSVPNVHLGCVWFLIMVQLVGWLVVFIARISFKGSYTRQFILFKRVSMTLQVNNILKIMNNSFIWITDDFFFLQIRIKVFQFFRNDKPIIGQGVQGFRKPSLPPPLRTKKDYLKSKYWLNYD